MSREIKFRAWGNKYKKMFRVSEISMDRDGYVHGLVDAGFNNEYRPENEDFKSPLAWIGRVDFVKSPTGRLSGLAQNTMDEPFYLMQYTGLKDKNGMEIYEGDILAINNTRYVVGYRAYSGGWQLEIKNEYCAEMVQGNCELLEIIGNIFENPELMEAKA